LAVNPAVMLMDEPLSALDSQTRELLMDDLISLWTRQPFTAVYVTHNLAEAVRLGHRIVVLSRRPGQIREVVELTTPLAERAYGDAALEAQQQHLWGLMREEAAAADAVDDRRAGAVIVGTAPHRARRRDRLRGQG